MRTKRSGITLIETLVVVVIIGILLAILLPAVQYVRESSRRMTCQNNLKQLALAIHNHESGRGSLPSLYNGTFLDKPRITMDEFHFHSWRVAILPELEQTTLFENIDFALPATVAANQKVLNTSVPVFICPSTPNANALVPDIYAFNDGSPPTQNVGTAARSDYEVMGGVNFGDFDSYDIVHKTAYGSWGEPKYDAATYDILAIREARLRDIRDGLSNTILVAERAGRPDLYRRGAAVDPYPNDMDHFQAAWGISTHFPWLIPQHAQSINQSNNMGIFSFHRSGAHACLADGSVRFLSQDINQDVVNALITRSHGDNPLSE